VDAAKFEAETKEINRRLASATSEAAELRAENEQIISRVRNAEARIADERADPAAAHGLRQQPDRFQPVRLKHVAPGRCSG
jgi:predicted  nucleic acid-binding Zn-ribbon protein